VFDVKQHNWTDLNTAICLGEWKIKDGGLGPEEHMKQRDSTWSMRDINIIPTAIPMFFSDQATWLDLCEKCHMSGWLVYQRWRSVTGSGYLPPIDQSMTWTSFRISPLMMLDAKKHWYSCWNFVTISHTSWDIRYSISTYGYWLTACHLWFLTETNKRQCLDQSIRVAWHRKHRYRRWNFVAIMYTSWDIRYSMNTSDYRPPSMIYYSPWRRVVYALPCFLTSQ